jgi:CobQ-like glutamine amidotransferase family enzyme
MATKNRRAIGEILVQPSAEWAAHGLTGPLTGFENHGAVTELRPGTHPAGSVIAGIGNQDGSVEGAVKGRVWGTYLHGPVLARNPKLADMLLTWAVGDLAPVDDAEPRDLHAERVQNGPVERRLGGVPAEHRRPWARSRPWVRSRPWPRTRPSHRTQRSTGT